MDLKISPPKREIFSQVPVGGGSVWLLFMPQQPKIGPRPKREISAKSSRKIFHVSHFSKIFQ
jgi:hypothetical protein